MRGCARVAKDPDMCDIGGKWYTLPVGRRNGVGWGGGVKFWPTAAYQYLPSSSHIISTGSTSSTSGHGLFNVVRDWKMKPKPPLAIGKMCSFIFSQSDVFIVIFCPKIWP